MEGKNMKLSDEVIAHVAKLLQLAILTGTDIVDHLRTISLDVDDERKLLYLNEGYSVNSEENIQKMLSQAEESIQAEA